MTNRSKVITKAIRLNAKEDALISAFLKANPFFDFSTLARTAIIGFIQQPTVSITPVVEPTAKVSRRGRMHV